MVINKISEWMIICGVSCLSAVIALNSKLLSLACAQSASFEWYIYVKYFVSGKLIFGTEYTAQSIAIWWSAFILADVGTEWYAIMFI